MNQTLRSAFVGTAAAVAAYGGILGVSHLAGQEPGPAVISDPLESGVVTAGVTGRDTTVAPGAKLVTPRVAPVSPTVSPTVTPRISPTPWPFTPPLTSSLAPTATPTPTPSPSATPTPSATPWPSSMPTPTPTPSPTPSPTPTPTPEPETEPTIFINEIAWAGTSFSSSDEWLELYNAGDADVDLTGWTLTAEDGSPSITFTADDPVISANGYYLLERTDDAPVSDIAADKIYTGALSNTGEILVLRDAQKVERDRVDGAQGWLAGITGSGDPPYASMERGTDGTWHSGGSTQVGSDAGGNPINGTPRSPNGSWQ